MKQKKLCTCGFIMVEAIVGVVLFALLLLAILQGIGFITHRIAIVAHKHKALCMKSISQGIAAGATHIAYSHPSITWYQMTAQSGDQTVTFYRAGYHS